MSRPIIVEYLGDSAAICYGEHVIEIARLSAGDTYGKHTVMQPSVVVDDVHDDGSIIGRFIVPTGTVRRIKGRCICPACSQ